MTVKRVRRLKSGLPSLMDRRNIKLAGEGKERLTQLRLSNETGLSTATVNRIYHGKFDRFDKATIEELINYFNCGVEELLVTVEVELQSEV